MWFCKNMYSINFLKKILVILGVLILAIFVSYYFVYREVRFRDETYQTLLRDLSFQDAKQEYLISTQRTMEGLLLDINHINDSVVSKEGDVEFIETLETIAKESGLTIEIDSLVLSNDPTLVPDSVDILKVKAKTKGSWANSYLFLSRLESLPFKLKIDSFGLSNTLAEVVLANKKVVKNSIWQSVFEISVLKYK